MRECIILAGGDSFRLKPHIEIPKPFVEIREGDTLLDAQLEWLVAYDFDNIIIALRKDHYSFMKKNYPYFLQLEEVQFSVEQRKKGTGGAIRQASELVTSERVYVMNADDITFYDPRTLYRKAFKGAAILVSKPRLPYGTVEFNHTGKVLRFRSKPFIDHYVSCGHYVLGTDIINEYIPKTGDIELATFQRMAEDGILYAQILEGKWLTVNTYKELLALRRELSRT